MAYDSTIPALGNLISNDIPAMQENFSLLENAQVVDEGSTSDGDYIRYENGWQVCTYIDDELLITSQTAEVLYRSDTRSFSFPVNFISAPKVATLGARERGVPWTSTNTEPTTSSTGTFTLFSSRENDEGYLGYIAIGRWK